jgi:hypothetical protein
MRIVINCDEFMDIILVRDILLKNIFNEIFMA